MGVVLKKKLRIGIRSLLSRKIVRSQKEQIVPITGGHICGHHDHHHRHRHRHQHLLLFFLHFSCSMLGSNLEEVVKNNIIWRWVWTTIMRERIFYTGTRPHHGWEAVMQSLNEPSSNLPERPVMYLRNGASSEGNFSFPHQVNSESQCLTLSEVLLSDSRSCETIWRVLWIKTARLLSNKIQREELKPGDHIYTWRHAYSYAHHGIYVGDGKVVHFTRGGGKNRIIFSSSASHPSESTCAISSDHSRLDRVVCTSIDDFLSGGELYRFEYGVSLALFIAKTRGGTCTLVPSAPLQVVQDRLAYHLNNGFGDYHLFKNNCEDFAVYCKTGFQVAVYNFSVGRSGQAVSFVVGITSFICSTIQSPAVISTVLHTILHFIIGYGIYSACRWASDIGVRPNVSKDADEGLAEEESSGCSGNMGGSEFKSALLKRLVRNVLVVAIWWICCYELQWTTEYMSYLLGWMILTGSAWVAFFVPIDSGRKENSFYFNLLSKHLRIHFICVKALRFWLRKQNSA